MFSIMTIASSTTKPVAMVSAISERLSSEKPQSAITAKVPTIESGSATAGISVARGLRRKSQMVITTSTTASARVNCTSRTEARIVSVRSDTIESCAPGGSARSSSGSCARMPSTVWTMLAPGWRCTSTRTAWRPSNQAPFSVFSRSSSAWPMSRRRTGAPLRTATIRLR